MTALPLFLELLVEELLHAAVPGPLLGVRHQLHVAVLQGVDAVVPGPGGGSDLCPAGRREAQHTTGPSPFREGMGFQTETS